MSGALVARRCLGEAGAAEWRVDVERIRRQPDPRRAASLRRRDLRPQSRSRCTPMCVNAPLPLHSPNAQTAGDTGLQSIVDDDVAVVVAGDTGRVESRSSVFGRRPTASQEMRSLDRRTAFRAVDLHRHAGVPGEDADRSAHSPGQRCPSRTRMSMNRRGHVVVFALDGVAAPSRSRSRRSQTGETSGRTRGRRNCRRRYRQVGGHDDPDASSSCS